jgi:hypothetical protein
MLRCPGSVAKLFLVEMLMTPQNPSGPRAPQDPTEAQLLCLRRALRDGGVCAGKSEHAGRVERMPASTILACIRRGWLKHHYGSEGGCAGSLTDAGRAIARELPATQQAALDWYALRDGRPGFIDGTATNALIAKGLVERFRSPDGHSHRITDAGRAVLKGAS